MATHQASRLCYRRIKAVQKGKGGRVKNCLNRAGSGAVSSARRSFWLTLAALRIWSRSASQLCDTVVHDFKHPFPVFSRQT